MNLNEKFDNAFRVLSSNRTREEKISLFLDGLIKEAEKIKNAREIILCGATPFAKTVLNNRELLFDDDVRLEIEDFIDEKLIQGGGYICPVLKTEY